MNKRVATIIVESAEHHFLSTLVRIQNDPQGWYGLYVGVSQTISGMNYTKDINRMGGMVRSLREMSRDSVEILLKRLEPYADKLIYVFTDGDVLALVRIADHDERAVVKSIHAEALAAIGREGVKGSLWSYVEAPAAFNDFAEEKRITAKKLEAYVAMADRYKRESLPVRRARRDEPVLLLVEDDRFTAAYTMHLLGQSYDIVHARSGEEAIVAYLEHAPDAVLMDIHLPGLSGNQTLAAIKAIDPEAYVVMLSVDTELTTVRGAQAGGANAYLKKPFSRERLHGAVAKSPFVRDHGIALSTAIIGTLKNMVPSTATSG